MIVEEILLLIYILNNAYTHASQPKWIVATQDKCVFTVSKNWTIKFERYPALFVNSLKGESYEDCRSACCSHQTCNGYVFDGSDKDDGCKLLKCSKSGADCKKDLEKYDKEIPGEVGFITGLTVPTVNQTSTQPTGQNHLRDESHIAILDEATSSVRPHLKVERKNNPTRSNSEIGLSETHLDSEIYALPSSRNQLMFDPTVRLTTSLEEEEMEKYNISAYMDPDEDIKEHTNSISLSIAFVFGLVFLFTVFYLTGKRWVEGIKDRQRRGYTRINYLLNGV